MNREISALQQDILNSSCDITNLLRKAHLIAVKYKLTEFDNWIQRELSGYPNNSKDIPDYRNVYGSVKANNPINGWIPIIFEDQELEQTLSQRKLYQPINEIVRFSKQEDARKMYIAFPGNISQQISQMAEFPMVFECGLFITRESMESVVENIKTRLWEWTVNLTQEETSDMESYSRMGLIELIDQVQTVKKYFKVIDTPGFPRVECIYSAPEFIAWKEALKLELGKLKQDDFIKGIMDVLNNFHGWKDKRLFDELAAKLKILKNNYGQYVEKSIVLPQEGCNGQPQSVTNNYFLGSISGSNISTGNNAEQELENTQPEEKSWMEKYGIQIVVALIGVAGAIIAAIIGLG